MLAQTRGVRNRRVIVRRAFMAMRSRCIDERRPLLSG
jgi:hypothetical protein